MTLRDEIDKPTRTLTLSISIGGTVLRPSLETTAEGKPGILGLKITKSMSNPVPVASIKVNRIPNWVNTGAASSAHADVHIQIGYNGLFATLFRGHVQDRAHGELDGEINAAGHLFPVYRTVQIPAQVLGNVTTKVAAIKILDYALGAGNYQTVGLDTGIEASLFTMGSVGDATLDRQTSGQMLQQIADLERWRIWEDNSGNFIFKNIYKPDIESFITYSTTTAATARIMRQRSREDPKAVRTRLTVRGDTITTGTPPDETTVTIEETKAVINAATTIPGLAPLPAGSFIDAEYSNSLVDASAKALSLAEVMLQEISFIPRQVTITVPGDPELDLGLTVTLDYPEKNLVGNFYIFGITHVIEGSGYTTILDLRGGENASQIGTVPDATFFPTMDREVFNDALRVFATFDASGSRSPDGGQLTFAWSDNQSPEITAPDITVQTAEIITVNLDPDDITGDWDVTLVVTDPNGLTATFTWLDVDVTEGGDDVIIPATFAAIDNRQSATPDGGLNWNDQTDVDVVSVTALPSTGIDEGIAVFGQADGTIMKTTDFCASALTEVKPTAAGNPKIQDMLWDWRNNDRVWAVDEDMRVYLSSNRGDGWGLYKDIKTLFNLASGASLRHIGLPAGGGIWVYGGDGIGNPFIAFDPVVGGHDWVNLTLGGDIATDGPAADSGCRIVDATDLGVGLVLAIENADGGLSGIRPSYFNANPFNTSGWQRGTGLAAGFKNSRFVVGDPIPLRFYIGQDNRSIWFTTNGVAWTERTNVFPVNVEPHHAIWLRQFTNELRSANVYLIACEDTSIQASGIYKSSDGLQTVDVHRPVAGFATWPTSSKGRQVAIGRTAAAEARLLVGYLLGTPTERGVSFRSSVVAFSNQIFTTYSINNDFFRCRALTDQLFFMIGHDFDTDQDSGEAVRSKNAGTTWDDIYAVPDTDRLWQDFARTADGVLWGLTIEGPRLSANHDHMEIWKAADGVGDSWAESKDDNPGVDIGQRIWTLIAHPTDPLKIAALGFEHAARRRPKLWYSLDGGETWASNVTTSNIFAIGTLARALGAMQLTSGRFVILQLNTTTDWVIFTSDDNGATWDARTTIEVDLSSHRVMGPVGEASGSSLYVLHADTSVIPTLMEIWKSDDFGTTWADIGNNAPTPSTADNFDGGLAYDPIEKALYVFGAGSARTSPIRHIMKLFPITADGVWTDVSDQIVPITGHTTYSVIDGTTHGIAFIPRSS